MNELVYEGQPTASSWLVTAYHCFEVARISRRAACGSLLAIISVAAVLAGAVPVHASGPVGEGAGPTVVLDLEWGDSPEQIGYSKHLAGYEDMHGGPTSFAVDQQGRVYVLDTVHECVKVFGPDGALVRQFEVVGTGREYGCISLGTGGEVWVHDPWRGSFDVYNGTGALVRSIEYAEKRRLGSIFRVDGERITCWSSWVVPARSPQGTGDRGEEVFSSTVVREGADQRTLRNSGIASARLYHRIERQVDRATGRLTSSSISVQDDSGEFRRLVFEDMDVLYGPMFIAEDDGGHVYFAFYYEQGKKPREVHRYTQGLEFVSRATPIEYNKGFLVTRDIVVTPEGDLYSMHLSDSGVKVMLWPGAE